MWLLYLAHEPATNPGRHLGVFAIPPGAGARDSAAEPLRNRARPPRGKRQLLPAEAQRQSEGSHPG